MRDGILAAAPILVVAALVFGPTAAWLAARRGRNPALWLAFGALLGPVALLLLKLGPPTRCPACAEPTGGFEAACRTCGAQLRSGARESSRTPGRGAGVDPAVRADPPAATVAEHDPAIAAAAPAVVPAPATVRAGRPRASRAGTAPIDPTANRRILRSVPDPEPSASLTVRRAADPSATAALPPTRTRKSRASTPDRQPAPGGGLTGGTPPDTGAGVERLSAIGVRRPSAATGPMTPAATERPGVVILAIGVFVQGSEPLLAGSRYLIARTDDKLMIIGPVDPTSNQKEMDFPLAGVEANFVGDRLVISGPAARAGARPFAIAFRSVAGLVPTPVDQAIMDRDGPRPVAAGRS